MKGCRPLTPTEIAHVLAAFTGKYGLRNKALFMLGLKTGFRITELVTLKTKDVVQSGRILSEIYLQRCNTKSQIEGRILRVNSAARAALASLVGSDQCNGSFLFSSRQGGDAHLSAKHASKILKQAFRKADIEGAWIHGRLSTHSMRKTFAKSIFINTGESLGITQDKLGHIHLASTVSYLKFELSDKEDEELMESI